MEYTNIKNYIQEHKNTYSITTIKNILINHGYKKELVEKVCNELGLNKEEYKIYNNKSLIYAIIGFCIPFLYPISNYFSKSALFNLIFIAILFIFSLIYTFTSIFYFLKSKKKKIISFIGILISIINLVFVGFLIIIFISGIILYFNISSNIDKFPQINVINVYAKNTTDNIIDSKEDFIFVLLNIDFKNNSFDYQDLIIELETNNNSQIMQYSQDEIIEYNNYNLNFDESVEIIKFKTQTNLYPDDNLSIKFTFSNIIVKELNLKIPENMIFQETYLYP